MNTETNFMNFENLTKLIEEHKKEMHPYKRYEFDSTSYTLLLISINNLIKENQELKKQLDKASLTIQEMIERDIYCPNSCDKLEELLKENQELKEKLDKYENPEDMTLMMMWCTEKVKDENETLKKQLDDVNEKILLLQASEPMLNYKKALEETQQKEFIKYLENMLDDENDIFSVVRVKNVLQKYKEIIGVSDHNKTNV